jgi:nucleoside-diphosphate kinase
MADNDAAAASHALTFLVEWFDREAALVRTFRLRYFPAERQYDMFDLKTNRTFLSKTSSPTFLPSDLYPGAQITVYSRKLKIVDYGDEFTRGQLGNRREPCFLTLKSSHTIHLAELLTVFAEAGLVVAGLKSCALTAEGGALVAGPYTAIQVIGANSSAVLRSAASKAARGSAWGAVEIFSGDDAGRQIELHFPLKTAAQTAPATQYPHGMQRPVQHKTVTTATGAECTLCLIKPHAVISGAAGPILHRLAEAGFAASAAELFSLDRPAAAEFLEVYKGVVPEYSGLVEQLAAGPVLALELQLPSEPASVVPRLRDACGPSDPEVARRLRPATIRARFGQDKVMNAVHCTDLPDDGALESQYFFSVLQE